MPLVSIIVPVYNVEKVLHYCINSILIQSISDFELILVDDGSPDNSGKICEEFAGNDRRISVIHKTNGGVSSARNTGIEVAQGEYICFVDSDDYLEKNYLEGLIEAKTKNPDVDNIWCGFQTVENYGGKNKGIIIAEKKCKISYYSIKYIMTLHEKWLVQMPWNKLFKTRIIKNNSLVFTPDLSLGEDLLFNYKYLDCTNGRIAVSNKTLYNYLRDGKESLDNRYYPNLLEIYRRLNNETEKYADKWKLPDKQLSKMYSAAFFRLESVLRNTYNVKNEASRREKIKYNNEILKSDDFQRNLEKMDAYIHPMYRFAYKRKSYFLVFCLDLITKLKDQYS